MADLSEVEAKDLAVHVAACIERNRGINARLKRLEWAIYGLIVALLANGSGPVTQALVKAFGG